MSDFFKEMLSKVDNEFAQCAEDGIAAGDVDEYIDTGSYVLNALVSGSLFKGFPKNKITALAGEQGTGKTFFCLSTIASFLKQHEDGGVFIFESESALTKQTMIDFGIDTKRVYVFPVETVQQFRNQALVIIDNYLKEEKKNRRPVLMVLDSLGMLSTSKEMEDVAAGKDTRDMTRAQLVRGAFRVLTLKLGKAGIPLLVTNHTYQTMDLFSKTEMSGGAGIRYASSIAILLSKKKEKDGTEHIGNVVHCKLYKGRLTKEGESVDTYIDFSRGLSRWYGLTTLAIDAGIFKKSGTKIETPQGTVFGKAIQKTPDKFFTPDVMEQLDSYCQKRFCYGTMENQETEISETEENDE